MKERSKVNRKSGLFKMVLALALCVILVACEAAEVETPTQSEPEIIDETKITLIQLTPRSETKATIKTSAGDIVIAVFENETPLAAENFITLAESGYYNGLRINEIVNEWQVVTGDPEDGTEGRSIWETPFEVESTYNLWHFSGAVAFLAEEDGNRSKIYFVADMPLAQSTIEELELAGFPSKVISRYREIGGAPWLDEKNTVFAQVVEGMDILNEIAKTQVNEENVPTQDIIIEEIVVERVNRNG